MSIKPTLFLNKNILNILNKIQPTHFLKSYKYLTAGLVFFLWSAFIVIPGLSDKPVDSQGDLQNIQVIRRASFIIQNYYYNPTRIEPQKMWESGLFDLSKSMPEVLVEFPTTQTGIVRVWVNHDKLDIPYTPPQKLFDIFPATAKIFDFIATHYKGDVKPEDREYAFINGLLEKLDPHSNLLTPKMYEEFKTQTEGEYGGIGLVVGMKEDELTAITPIEDTPAMRAGILSDDKIVQIDDLPTINMPLSEAVSRLRGKVGTKLVLQIHRKNHDPLEVTLVREQINIKSVKSKLVTIDDNTFGVIRVASFQEDTFADFDKAIKDLRSQSPNLKGFVIDLRNNPGGLLDQATKMVDRFLSSGDIVYTVGGAKQDEEVTEATAQSDDVTTLPVIALVNQGSASAAEIVSGALQGSGRAMLMGTKTFGKGSVQTLFPLQNGASLKLTIAQYLTPNKVSIQAVGINPDIQLLPQHVETGEFDLIEDEKTFGEKDLEDHLENKDYLKITKPALVLPYLEDAKKDDSEKNEYSSHIDEVKDRPLALALKVLAKNPPATREGLIQTTKTISAETIKTESEQVHEALKKLSIDWTAGLVGKNNNLEVTSQWTVGNQPVKEIHAGDDLVWNFSLTNKGATPLFQVAGVIKSEHPRLSEQEIIIGKILPSETKTGSITIKFPPESVAWKENIKTTWYSGKTVLANTPTLLTVIDKTHPDIAYTYSLLDNGQEGSKGNGNLIPEAGETIVINLTVKNRGTSTIEDGVVNLKSDGKDAMIIDNGRVVFGNLAAGSEKKGSLKFNMNSQNLPPTLEFNLNFFDRKTRTGFDDKFLYSLKDSKIVTIPPNNTFLSPPSIQLTKKEVSAGELELSLAGVVTDDASVSNVMISNNGKKIFYQAASVNKKETTTNFEKKIPLKEGINLIEVSAMDDRQLITSIYTAVVKQKK